MKLHCEGVNTILFVILLIVAGTGGLVSYGQQNSRAAVPHTVDDTYSMSPYSRFKPEMRYFLVRLKGDNGVSIIDLDGNIISRNFMPVTNSQGKVDGSNNTTPVLNDIFCVERSKRSKDFNGKWSHSFSVYRNASRPTPIKGLTDLGDANICNPNLFPVCKRGERIKFFDSKGNEKFTVMPIDGKEPRSVSPMVINGMIIVRVEYDVKTEDHVDDNGEKLKCIIKSTEKEGAIDTTGKWVVYPEWDRLEPDTEVTLIGYKDGERYIISSNGEAVRDTLADNFSRSIWRYISSNYIIEEFWDNYKYASNIYDLNQNYITTLENADYIRPNWLHPNILLVRRDFKYGHDRFYDHLVDLNNNTVISKNYDYMKMLPNGNYIAFKDSIVKGNETRKCWYVKANGTATPLPNNCEFPLKHPWMAFYYDTDITRFIVQPGKDGTPGYICDFNGNKVGNLLIEEFYNLEWEAEPVGSSYWRKYIYGVDD